MDKLQERAATVSLIATVKDEARSIQRLLDSISAQTRPPDEVLIADGGSRDETPRLLEAWGARQPFPVQVLRLAGANIAQGRNAAIRAARGDVIAVTDAGVRLDERWLERLVAPLEGTGDPPQAVAGFFLPDPHNAFEMAMAATVLPRRCEIDARTFLPSSRSVAFSKAAWQAVGGYPEWLDYCEDLVFDCALRVQSAMAFAPQALVYFRPRGSLGAFFKQYYRYARGDGKADLWRKRHAIRYLTYLVAAPLLVGLGLKKSPVGWLLLGAGAAAYCRRPLLRLMPYFGRLSIGERLYAIALIPLIRLVGDCAKMLGYPVGLWWRLKRRL